MLTIVLCIFVCLPMLMGNALAFIWAVVALCIALSWAAKEILPPE